MTYYTIYKITNKMNGKIYIGSHKTCNLNDKYMGSGKYLKRAIEKHGIDNFVKKILFVFDTPELMYAKEAEIVDEDFLTEEDTYNLKVGGLGGFDYLNSEEYENPTHSTIHSKKMELARLKKYPNGPFYGRNHSEETKEQIKTSAALLDKRTFLGRSHTEETKNRMRESARLTSKGKRNSQFGTMWVTNEVESMKVKKTDNIPEGYRKGRKLK